MAIDTIESFGRILRISLIGKLTSGDITKLRRKLIDMIAVDDKARDLLVNMKQAELSEPEAKEEAKRLLKDIPFRRMAIYGTRPSVVTAINWIIKTVSYKSEVKLFRDEQLAIEWLGKSNNPFRPLA